MPSRVTSVLALCVAAGCTAGRAVQSPPTPSKQASVTPTNDACTSLAAAMQTHWPDPSTRVLDSHRVAAGTQLNLPMRPPVALPAHCELIGVMQERVGVDGQHYAIKFHLRLPQDWNGRFFFQGGGGSNGDLGDALGFTGMGSPAALDQGYAVVSQDSGHDNAVNTVPERNGALAFAFDPQARANYGGASLKPVAEAAKAAITVYYGHAAQRSYFFGCSKGGQEGMMFAQRYPEVFDGIVAGAPGFSLPKAALAEVWDTQSFAGITGGDGSIDPQRLSKSFSDAELAIARDAVLAACDAQDGARDGITSNFAACTTSRVMAELNKHRCTAATAKTGACLQPTQINALQRVYAGAQDSHHNALYSDWPWDAGIGSANWRMWKIGAADGSVPSLNLVLGGASLSAAFTTPPTALTDPASVGHFVASFDFDRDAPKIYATNALYQRSAWQDIGARSPDLSAFRQHGGKLLVPHGASDPVFSLNDTLAWYREVDELNRGQADQFVRVLPVPGMTHCNGGPATDQFDALTALVAWVEKDQAPDRVIAKAGSNTPWPERTRPLCAYPKFAKYKGSGSVEDADNFVCEKP